MRPNPIVLSTALIAAGALLTTVGAVGEVARARKPRRPLFSRTSTGALALADSRFEDTFGRSTEADYPAPYRWQDTQKIVDVVLGATGETAPAFRQHHDTIRDRYRALERSNKPPWEKTRDTIRHVVLPAYAANLFWHWYRPRSPLKDDRFNAIIAWATMFWMLPETSGTADPRAHRTMLLDVARYLREWGHANLPDYDGLSGLQQLVGLAGTRVAELQAAYPPNDPDHFVVEGNFKLVDEIVWFANARVQQAIHIDFDAGAAWAALVVRIVGAVVSAVAPHVSPAVAAGIQSAATAVQGIAQIAVMMSSGDVSRAQVQAMLGAGVASLLEKAAIRLGLEDELGEIEDLAGAADKALSR